MTNTRSPDPLSIDPEELAAYIDGTLDPTERADLEARLADDDDALEVLADTLRTLAAIGDDSDDRVVAPLIAPTEPEQSEERARPVAPLALAAVLLVTVAGLLVWFLPRPDDDAASSELLAALPLGDQLELAIGKQQAQPTWSPARGHSGELLASPLSAFRVGALRVDLAAALRARDAHDGRYLARQLLATLEPIAGAEAVALHYDEVALLLQEGSVDQAAELAERAEELAPVTPETYYETGRWTAAGWLAARSRTPEFFDGRYWRSGLTRLREHAGTPALLDIVAALEPPLDFERAEEALNELRRLLGNGDAQLEID